MSKIVNVYIVYDLDANLTNNFKLNNYLFGATSMVKNKDMDIYSCYKITFDSADS